VMDNVKMTAPRQTPSVRWHQNRRRRRAAMVQWGRSTEMKLKFNFI
jgi:hypothetical protein